MVRSRPGSRFNTSSSLSSQYRVETGPQQYCSNRRKRKMAGSYVLKALPQTPQFIKDDGIQETPGPVRARLAMMDKQMDQLHKEKSLLEVSLCSSAPGHRSFGMAPRFGQC